MKRTSSRPKATTEKLLSKVSLPVALNNLGFLTVFDLLITVGYRVMLARLMLMIYVFQV
jgi:hypothetical protein